MSNYNNITNAPEADDLFDAAFYDVIVDATLQQLTSVLGEPLVSEGDKVSHEWKFMGPDGLVTLYDWRGSSVRNKWHVGGKDKIATMSFARWLRSQL